MSLPPHSRKARPPCYPPTTQARPPVGPLFRYCDCVGSRRCADVRTCRRTCIRVLYFGIDAPLVDVEADATALIALGASRAHRHETTCASLTVGRDDTQCAFDHLTDAAMEGDAVSSGEFIVERFSNEMVREAEPAGDRRNRIDDARIDGLLQEREQPDTRDVAHSPKRLQRELSSDHRCHRRRARSPTAPTSPRTLPSTSALCSPEVGNQRSDAAFAAHVGVWHCTPYVTGREGAAREGAHGRRDRRRVQGLAGEGYPALSEGFRYSFFAVRDGVVLVGYDNHVPKGHHRHFGGKQEPYAFEGLDKLRADFKRDLERARLRITEGA